MDKLKLAKTRTIRLTLKDGQVWTISWRGGNPASPGDLTFSKVPPHVESAVRNQTRPGGVFPMAGLKAVPTSSYVALRGVVEAVARLYKATLTESDPMRAEELSALETGAGTTERVS